jgi:hypothetical protein
MDIRQTTSSAELSAIFAGLGLPQKRAANLLGVRPRHLRRWRRGERRVPHGIRIVLNLLRSGAVTIDQVEAAAQVNGRADPGPAPADPDPLAEASTLADPDSVAGKVCSLPLVGACKWPLGDIDDSARFRFCRAPSAVGQPYCPDHQALAVRPRIVKVHRLYRTRPDQRASAPEALDREDIEILAHARACRAVPMELVE